MSRKDLKAAYEAARRFVADHKHGRVASLGVSGARLHLFDDVVVFEQVPGLLGGGAISQIRPIAGATAEVVRDSQLSEASRVVITGPGWVITGPPSLLQLRDRDEFVGKVNALGKVAHAGYIQQPVQVGPPSDVAGQLAQLAGLRDSGALSEQEFATAKARLLG